MAGEGYIREVELAIADSTSLTLHMQPIAKVSGKIFVRYAAQGLFPDS